MKGWVEVETVLRIAYSNQKWSSLVQKSVGNKIQILDMYSGCPNTKRSVWQTELKSVRLSNIRFLDVRFVQLLV